MLIRNELFFEQIDALLAEGQEATFRLRGDSMRPLLRNGRDVVVVAPCDPMTLKRGDVVLFRYRGRHILHRIVRCEGDRLLLAGDGNYRTTEACCLADVVGRLVRVQRPSGREITCASRSWRWRSRLWLCLPPLVRRVILGVARRLP